MLCNTIMGVLNTMNKKTFIIAVICAVITFIITDLIIHSMILSPYYETVKQLWRQNMGNIMWIMNIGQLILASAMVYIFSKNFENKGIFEGMRFGFLMSLLIIVPGSLGQYVVYPVPGKLALLWIAFGITQYIIVGIVISLIFKPNE